MHLICYETWIDMLDNSYTLRYEHEIAKLGLLSLTTVTHYVMSMK